MPTTFMIAPTMIIVGVLIASGIAKLRHPDDDAGWEALGIPLWLRRDWLIRAHPYAELLLAATMLFIGGKLGMVAAATSVVLFATYLAFVWRALLRIPDASCACFGTRTSITARTLARNTWFLLLAVAAATTIGEAPLVGGIASVAVESWPWLAAAAAGVVTAILVQESRVSDVEQVLPRSGKADVDGEYVRARTPAVPVQLGGGETVNLRELTAEQALLALVVSDTCGHCQPVIDNLEEYRTMLPEVSVRLLLQQARETSTLTSDQEPQTLHDPHRYVSGSIADWRTPTAVLFGTDGLLAGGPVTGAPEIREFVEVIHEGLHGQEPTAPAKTP